jgi:UDP-N-acetylglucosamine 2-epimerase (non-hydrolysing)
MKKPTLLFVIGTRPEAIKTAPVIHACQASGDFRVQVLTTSQHRELQDAVLDFFDIQPDHDLNLMRENSNLTRLVAESWRGVSDYIESSPPDLLLVQGDTTTAFIAALASIYQRIPVAHIEAGLRTYDAENPFPEEINRRLITHIAALHFAPTLIAKENVLRENIDPATIYVVGNPGIDALQFALHRITPDQRRQILDRHALQENLILVTSHRRENWGDNLRNICQALQMIAAQCQDISILFLVHPNPEVSRCVHEELADHSNIHLLKAVPYLEMAVLMEKAALILTDSGGIQEEAPFLGKPVLILREKTERPEVLQHQAAILVGTDPDRIRAAVCSLLSDSDSYRRYAIPRSIFGDGQSAARILRGIRYHFDFGPRPADFIPPSPGSSFRHPHFVPIAAEGRT